MTTIGQDEVSEPDTNLLAPTKITLTKSDKVTFNEIDFVEIPPADVFAFNELRTCADLYRMCRDHQLEIQPYYQRGFVWSNSTQTRFIDSLAKSLPIPSMCFSMDTRTGNWQVIDGQQRMRTIVRFFEGNWKLEKLPDVDTVLSGATIPEAENGASEGSPELRQFFRRIENKTLPITVLRCDTSDPSHMEYVFTIFHRLNAGGSKLNNQEIRNCIYSGQFNDLLIELDRDQNWLKINGGGLVGTHRLRGQEVILRFFALYESIGTYKSSLARFLNDYMFANRHPAEEFLDDKRLLFSQTVEVVWYKVLGGSYRHLSVSVLEALLVGVATNRGLVEKRSAKDVQEMFHTLLRLEEFSDEALRAGLARKDKVEARIEAAIRTFAGS